jgi:hypothetical protein
MNKTNKKLALRTMNVRVLSAREVRGIGGGLRAGGGGGGGCCGAGSELKDIYTGMGRACCDVNSELMKPNSGV